MRGRTPRRRRTATLFVFILRTQNGDVVNDFGDLIRVVESEFHKEFYVMEDRLQVHILKGNWVLAEVPVVSSEAARTALVGARPALHTARHSAYQRGRRLGVVLPS
ncbi:hypothetical protein E2C01_101535 [Portunus trituberculatus]|uniref:Uncharacterized protein n=1 Tax=Portunus trituberculatus TaxID=210409 RepID=A0A5B7K9V3_PORTR|nr:hypothetical protein [Portunus trituberculatus]